MQGSRRRGPWAKATARAVLALRIAAMLSLSVAVPGAWHMAGPRRATADRRVLPVRASEADAALWTLGLAAAAYFSSYASEGYEPHRL